VFVNHKCKNVFVTCDCSVLVTIATESKITKEATPLSQLHPQMHQKQVQATAAETESATRADNNQPISSSNSSNNSGCGSV
jgi:hypothetical protein